MTIIKRIISISAGICLLSLLFISSTLLGILTDRQEDAREYYMEAGSVAIELTVDNGDTEAILIQPNQTTPLNISITNTGTKDCYVFVELEIPEINNTPILSITPTGNWAKVDVDGRNVYQYVVYGEGKALESGLDTPEMVSEARFYDFKELVDFEGTLRVIAYAVQTDGFEDSEVIDVWTATVQAVGE